MFMDRNFKIFGKVAVIDILLLIFMVVFIMAASQFAAPTVAKAAPGDTRIKYTVEFNRKRPDFINNIVVGETLYDTQKGYEIGTIIEVYDVPYREETPNFEANMISRPEIEGLYSVYITVEANAQVVDGSTNIGLYQVMVGKEAYVKSRSFAGSGYIVILEK